MRRLLASPWARRTAFVGWTGAAVAAGYVARRSDEKQQQRVLPSGSHACCEGTVALTAQQAGLKPQLTRILGADHVSFGVMQRGARLGRGEAFAVCKPGTLQEALECLQACVDHDCAVVPQGANTGLTGGSVPRDADTTPGLDRPSVVINFSRLRTITPIDDGKRLVCLAGAGIQDALHKANALGVDSHSVLGSFFLNPTVAAGVAFGSGGTQLRKGPVYTERVLYAKVNEQGKVEVVDSLGLRLSAAGPLPLDNSTTGGAVLPATAIATSAGVVPQAATASTSEARAAVFRKLERGELSPEDVDASCALPASQKGYGDRACDCEGAAGLEVNRWNADVRGSEPCRSEGKVLLLASCHDTFPKPLAPPQVIWVSVKDLATVQRLRRAVCLGGGAQDLPVSCEYMDGDAVIAVDEGGRALCFLLKHIGTGPWLKRLWGVKVAVENSPLPFAATLADSCLYAINALLPDPLPPRVRALVESGKTHHVAIGVGEFGTGEVKRLTERLHAFAEQEGKQGLNGSQAGADAPPVEVHWCSPDEAAMVGHFRFAAAPAFRTWCVGKGLEGVSVDYALPKAQAALPDLNLSQGSVGGGGVALRMRYSHLGCNVVHEDVAFTEGTNATAAKYALKGSVEGLGGKLPAEHGHGTEYVAPPEMQARWKSMDPLNVFNPGIGGLPNTRRYGTAVPLQVSPPRS